MSCRHPAAAIPKRRLAPWGIFKTGSAAANPQQILKIRVANLRPNFHGALLHLGQSTTISTMWICMKTLCLPFHPIMSYRHILSGQPTCITCFLTSNSPHFCLTNPKARSLQNFSYALIPGKKKQHTYKCASKNAHSPLNDHYKC